ncbi:MAG: tRNA (adenosine(37)-N6)-threonylcarbamoyltransferase complex transferase subunit TsaD [Bacteroidales bacterium]|nr:tRNA (adenosine(37)-N6)-threonylcarbamoyltransferase complex transferase subunit TsaD [Bacteroidales bacterium]MDD4603944.1 tRNA (adenosine(37)-N6)-threonylcarbamoyltransferase complex transferase subunit TsaD [Bacteroidales bacterium]
METYILGIESSCDDTAAAIICNDVICSNVTAGQEVHKNFGGVVPELASRAHQQNIIPVVDTAIQKANISKKQLSAIAFTRGPGLLGSLLVGTSFAKAMALGLNIPLIEVNHLHAHIMAHFIRNDAHTNPIPKFPFLCLTVSGGHTQIVLVHEPFNMEVIGQTIDDAAGETFDKAAKIMGLPYPGGPVIDELAKQGDGQRFGFAKPVISGLNFSFSGLKTAILYFLRDQLKIDPEFILKNKADLAASIQQTIIDILLQKLVTASNSTGIREIAIAGGVSANSGLRTALLAGQLHHQWNVFIPSLSYSTDNAAMIAIAGYYKFLKGEFSNQQVAPYARSS